MSRLSLGKAQLDYDSRVPDSVDADQECERCGVQSFSEDGALCIVAIPEEGSVQRVLRLVWKFAKVALICCMRGLVQSKR